jgi:LacI family transcriptional regulator
LVTLKEIAAECGVSTATVSNILNGKKKVSEETKARVLEVVEKRGYKLNYIAQGLRKQKTQTIGIIAEDISQFTTPLIIEGIMENCEARGYRTIVQNLRLYARWHDAWFDNEKMYHSVMDPAVQEMASIRVDGIVYVAGHARKIHRFPTDYQIPSVLAYAYSEQKDIPSVVINDEEGAREIVAHLIAKGHTRIGVLAGDQDNMHTKLRIIGYQKALYEAGLLYNPEDIVYAGWGREHGYKKAAKLLEKGVTAVFCMNDRIAGGLYAYLYEHNLQVGKDISVVGFDNEMQAEYMLPGLTTMKIDLVGIGKNAVDVLMDSMEGKEVPRKTSVACQLIERGSVGKP